MSPGPSALGTILIQRLDAVMGSTLAAHANLISGARPNAVTQPGALARPGESENATSTDKRNTVDPAGMQDKGQAILRDAKLQTVLLATSGEQTTSTEATASAPTTLGQTARTILALLAQYPERAPSLSGKAPLWPPTSASTVQSPALTPQESPTPSSPSAAMTAKTEAQTATALLLANNPKQTTLTSAEVQVMARMPEPSVAVLAQSLRQTLQHSGLFYESHLADLAFGRRTIAQLESEPQARLAPASNNPAGTALRTANLEGLVGNGTHAGTHTVTGIHSDASLLVRQQLDVLAYQAFAWRGEAWPGTPLEWEIERGKKDTAGSQDTLHTWTTRLTLDLPRLGKVEARLSLAGNQLVMQLVAPFAEQQISASSDKLRERLLAAGLTLSNISVSARPLQSTLDSDE